MLEREDGTSTGVALVAVGPGRPPEREGVCRHAHGVHEEGLVLGNRAEVNVGFDLQHLDG